MKNNDQTHLLDMIEDVPNMTMACLDNKMLFLFGHMPMKRSVLQHKFP